MPWSVYVAHLFGGAFLANALPHLIAGLTATPLPTAFGSPPFRGMSSPVVNVVYALINLALAYVLLVHVGTFDLRSLADAAVCFAGFGLMALQCARSITRIRSKAIS